MKTKLLFLLFIVAIVVQGCATNYYTYSGNPFDHVFKPKKR
jgi:hypothetical protein